MGERWADNQFTFNNFNIEDVVIHQTNGLCSQLGVGFGQLLLLDTGQNQFCCQPRRVGSKKASTYYRPLQSFLAQYSAVNVPYLHRPAAFWDRWIRILTDISAKAKPRHTFIHLTILTRHFSLSALFQNQPPEKGHQTGTQNTAATPAALQNSGVDVVSTHQTSSQALARLFKSSKCFHGNLLSQGASFAGEIPAPLLFKRGRQFGRSIMPA